MHIALLCPSSSFEARLLLRTHLLFLPFFLPSTPTHTRPSLLAIEAHLGSKEEGEDLRLSTRQLTRLARRLAAAAASSSNDPQSALDRLPRLLHETLLTAFAPAHVVEVVNDVLRRAGLPSASPTPAADAAGSGAPPTITATAESLSIGGVTVPKRRAARPELVPRPWPYHDNPQHTRVLAQLLQDYASGERSILLVGNQVNLFYFFM